MTLRFNNLDKHASVPSDSLGGHNTLSSRIQLGIHHPRKKETKKMHVSGVKALGVDPVISGCLRGDKVRTYISDSQFWVPTLESGATDRYKSSRHR